MVQEGDFPGRKLLNKHQLASLRFDLTLRGADLIEVLVSKATRQHGTSYPSTWYYARCMIGCSEIYLVYDQKEKNWLKCNVDQLAEKEGDL